MKYRQIFFGKDRFHFIKERFRALESRVLRRVFGRLRIQNIGENCTTNKKKIITFTTLTTSHLVE
jgi:hypothetical protein